MVPPPALTYRLDASVHRCCARETREGYSLIRVAEGARSEGGQLTGAQTLADNADLLRLGDVAAMLAHQLYQWLRSVVRATRLGPVQRGGASTLFERALTTTGRCPLTTRCGPPCADWGCRWPTELLRWAGLRPNCGVSLSWAQSSAAVLGIWIPARRA